MVQRDGSVGVGPYTMEYRKTLLNRLHVLQESIEDVLITPEEESRIYQIWAAEQAELALLVESKMEASEQ